MLVSFVVACGDPELTDLGPIELSTFAVSDFFTPSGHMGDGETPGHLKMEVNENCRVSDTEYGNCYRFTYGPPSNRLWAGVFWVSPANNWGSEPGRSFYPWVFDKKKGVIRQRYNRIRFTAAARRDTFEVSVRSKLVDADGKTHCYTLRDAVFEFSGASSVKVDGNATLKDSPKVTAMSPCPDAKALIVLPPGDYKVKLRSGFTVEVDGMTASAAQPAKNPLSFELDARKTSSEKFKLDVDGTTVAFEMSVPRLDVAFFAGGIRSEGLESIRCPNQGETCRYVDNVLTGAPKTISVQLGRELTKESIPSSTLRFEPPCVKNAKGEGPKRDDTDSTMVCPDGTWTKDGQVATCPLGLSGAMQKDGKIICCDGGNPTPGSDGKMTCGTNDMRDPKTGKFVSTPRPIFTGKWRYAEDIEGTLLGAFGWSVSYGEFETASGSGELKIPASEVPMTYLYLDSIIWDYAKQPKP
jgi:hypothetical protein